MNPKGTNRKAVEALSPGDHISDNVGVHQLAHVLTYRDGDGRERRALTLNPIGSGGEPWVARYAVGDLVHVATDDEVREAREIGRRIEVAEALRTLADQILEYRLPVPRWHLGITGCLDSRADVERWAVALDGEVEASARIPATTGCKVGSEIVEVRMQGPKEAEPEVADEVASDAQAVMAEAGRAMNATGAVEVYEAKPLQVDNAIAAAEALEPKNTGRLAECGCPFFQDPLEDDPTVIHDTACQDWYFTFGSGHTHPESPAVNAEGGVSLADRYVVIRGTYESARAIMLRFFGRVWCDQYETAEKAGVERFGLTELHRRHWPTPAVDVAATDAQSGR